MPSKPKEGETQQEFMGRCMEVMHTSEKDRPQPQKVAICFSMWRQAHPKDKSANPPAKGK